MLYLQLNLCDTSPPTQWLLSASLMSLLRTQVVKRRRNGRQEESKRHCSQRDKDRQRHNSSNHPALAYNEHPARKHSPSKNSHLVFHQILLHSNQSAKIHWRLNMLANRTHCHREAQAPSNHHHHKVLPQLTTTASRLQRVI